MNNNSKRKTEQDVSGPVTKKSKQAANNFFTCLRIILDGVWIDCNTIKMLRLVCGQGATDMLPFLWGKHCFVSSVALANAPVTKHKKFHVQNLILDGTEKQTLKVLDQWFLKRGLSVIRLKSTNCRKKASACPLTFLGQFKQMFSDVVDLSCHVCPESVEHLPFEKVQSCQIHSCSLESLEKFESWMQKCERLRTLCCDFVLKKLPPSLDMLKLYCLPHPMDPGLSFPRLKITTYDEKSSPIPACVKHLSINKYGKGAPPIPQTVESLRIRQNFHNIQLGAGIKVLELDEYSGGSLSSACPHLQTLKLRHLRLEHGQDMTGYFPSSIESIEIFDSSARGFTRCVELKGKLGSIPRLKSVNIGGVLANWWPYMFEPKEEFPILQSVSLHSYIYERSGDGAPIDSSVEFCTNSIVPIGIKSIRIGDTETRMQDHENPVKRVYGHILPFVDSRDNIYCQFNLAGTWDVERAKMLEIDAKPGNTILISKSLWS